MPAWIAHPVLVLVEGVEWLLARAAGAVWLLALAALGHGAVKVLPPYLTHHALRDRVAEIARMPVEGDTPEIHSALRRAVEERRLGAYIAERDCRIESRQTSRRITCRYQVPVEILPGRTRLFDFQIDVEQPLLMERRPNFI